MKKILLILCIIGLPVWAETTNIYEPSNSSVRTIRGTGNGNYSLYDNSGNYKGRVRDYSNGRRVMYDQNNNMVKTFRGAPANRTHVFDAEGNKVGTEGLYPVEDSQHLIITETAQVVLELFLAGVV